MLNRWQKAEIDCFESAILRQVFGKPAIPDSLLKILKALRINPTRYKKLFEDSIEPYLRESGECDGQFLGKTLAVWKPKLADAINIPDKDFRLQTFAETIMASIFKERRS